MQNLLSEVDQRGTHLRSSYISYALPPFQTLQEWQAHAQDLREHILSVCGLLPMPVAPPLRAHIFDTLEYPDYAVSKVYFQSYPGLLVTGNLFVPRGKDGPFPAVLNPHGHWSEGRMVHCEDASLPARGISFARQGYVAFCYDMIGYNDATQLPHPQGPSETDRQALWGLGLMALQTYNSIRSIDFLQSLPIVDGERIGCTGESGGGTQTFILAAVDDRIKVSVPVNMISAHMQGGCRCENAPTLRLNATNPEIAALMAPRPMLIISASGDWTKNTPTVEYPYIKSIYQLFDAAERVEEHQVDAGHNYNLVSRNAVYPFFAKWLLGASNPEQFQERPFKLAAKKKYLVWADCTRPRYAPEGDKLFGVLEKAKKSTIQERWPKTKREFGCFTEQMGSALKHILSVQIPSHADLQSVSLEKTTSKGIITQELLLSRKAVGDRIPALLLSPPAKQRNGKAALVVSPEGSAALTDSGTYSPLVAGLLAVGHRVLIIDCWGTGKAQTPSGRNEEAVKTMFPLTYNRSDDANRIQDILTGLAYLQTLKDISHINLLGLGSAGVWVLTARTQAPFIQKTIVDMAGFKANKDEAYIENLFVPMIRGVGGVETAAALIAPGLLTLHNVAPGLDTAAITQAYSAAGAKRSLSIEQRSLADEEIIARIESNK